MFCNVPCFSRPLVAPSCPCSQVSKPGARVVPIHLCDIMRWCNVDESDLGVGIRNQIMRRKILSSPLSDLGLFPRFDKPEVRGGKQHLERRNGGRRREKRGGSRGLYSKTPPISLLFPRSYAYPSIIYAKKGGFDPKKHTRTHSHYGDDG